MKLLKKLLLINWHYFSHQMIEFEQLNYMTGVNASGKSTIIDALQLVLLQLSLRRAERQRRRRLPLSAQRAVHELRSDGVV